MVGGLAIEEPAADLAAAAAIASSLRDQPVRADLALIGEVGLSGELRWVAHMEPRHPRSSQTGLQGAVIPQRLRAKLNTPAGFEVLEARSLAQAIKIALLTK